MSNYMRFVLATAALCATGAAALADDLRVPSQFARIEDAAAAARAGDRIVVRGRIRAPTRIDVADVVVDLTRARIDGRLTMGGPRTTVLGGDLRGGLSVHGDHATVRGARVRGTGVIENPNLKTAWLTPNGGFAVVWVVGDDATLDGLEIRAPVGATAIASAADRLVVRGCDVRGGAAGADLEGDAVVVSGSRFTGESEFGIGATSTDAQITGNVVASVRRGDAVYVRGDRALVAGNAIRTCLNGIVCDGADAVIRDNGITSSVRIAIDAWGEAGGCTIVRNRIRAARGAGISAAGQGVVVEENEVQGVGAGRSIAAVGNAGAVNRNTVVRPKKSARADPSGSVASEGGELIVDADSGVFVDGIWNAVCGNDVSGGGTGITVCGCANTVDADVVRDVAHDGIVVAGEGSSVTNAVVDGAARDIVTFGDVSTWGLESGVRLWSFPTNDSAPTGGEQPTPDETPVGTDLPLFSSFLGAGGD